MTASLHTLSQVVAPMYLAEIAPQSVRGMIIMMYAACQQLGVVFGFWCVLSSPSPTADPR